MINLVQGPSLKLVSQPGEDERDFLIRAGQAACEKRDELVEALHQKYAPKIATLEERSRKAQAAVEKQQEPARQAKLQTAVAFGATLLGAFTGRGPSAAAPWAKQRVPHAGLDVHPRKSAMSHAPTTRSSPYNRS